MPNPDVQRALMLLTLAAFCFSPGCHFGQGVTETMPADGEDMPIAWQTSGTYSRLNRAIRLVIRDRATLSQIPLCDVPVDFSMQMVLLAGLGPTSRNDLGVRIERVWREHSRVHVVERQIYPGHQETAGLRRASPWTIVVVPRSDLDVDGYDSRIPRSLLQARDVP